MKHFSHIIIAMAATVLAGSCSIKEYEPDIVSPYTFFKTEPQLRAAVNGAYDPLNTIHNLPLYIAIEGTSDLASTNGSAQKDAKLDINPASPGAGNTLWQYAYRGIRYCISTVAGINRSSLDENIKAPYRAEAEILESYYWYLLTSFFGDVPFYQDYVETDDDLTRIARIGRCDAFKTRETLIEMLRADVAVLPQIRTSDNPKGYCGAAMGWLMMAKLAAWNKDWDTVIDACQHLESIYGDLNQYPYEDVMWRNKLTPESIFEIQHVYVEGGVSYITPWSLPVSSITMPYPKEAGAAIYDKVTIDEIGSQATCYTPLRPTTYYKGTVFPGGGADVRRSINMCSSWNGVSFPSSRVWMGPKFWCPGIYQTRDSNNYKILRYADALLLMSEAYCEKGMYEESLLYLNKVRARANAEPLSFQSGVKLRGEIRDERGRELFGEWGRKFDLVRWGIWYDQVKAYNLYNLVQDNIKPCHEYYPIPDTQCQISGGVLSNPEYAKYNLAE